MPQGGKGRTRRSHPAPAPRPKTGSTRPSPPELSARGAALAALRHVFDRRVPMETALAEAPGFTALEARDRAFARLLVATALRRAGETEAILARLIERPLPDAAREARHILALGLVQLLHLGTPPHAAVATAVALADRGPARKFKGLINAVLRRAAREGAVLLAGIDPPRADTPDWLWRAWSEAYGEASARAVAEAHLGEPPLDLTPRDPGEAEALAAELEAEVLPTGTLRRASGGLVPELRGYGEGKWWVQDAAAALPARLLRDVRNMRVLDLCTAPGGKTLQLAAAGAFVTAVDAAKDRLRLVAENLARTGLAAELIAADGRSFRAAPFDAVLLDAPCTATGTIRRHPDILRTRAPEDVARAVRLQDALLANAARLVRPGGYLVYAVCSLEPAEGEHRVTAFLDAHPAFSPDPVTQNDLPGLQESVAAAGFLRTLPCFWSETGGMDGFFAARLRRGNH